MGFGRLDVTSTPHIFETVLICQVIGGAVGLLAGFHHFWFLNLWFGGAVATPIGFVIGLKREVSSRAWRESPRVGSAAWSGCLCFAIGLASLCIVLPMMLENLSRLRDLRQLPAAGVTKISIYADDWGNKWLRDVQDRTAIAQFVQASRDAEGYTPSHDRAESEWFLVLHGKRIREFQFYTCEKHPETIIGEFVDKSGNSMSSHGHFSSKALRRWFREHATPRAP